MLTDRQLVILKTIIDEFAISAEPVGSKLLIEKYGLPYSSATIRNEMAILEELGYLEKTHTSSGRVPSLMGYRFYVDSLMEINVEDEVKQQLQTVFYDRRKSVNEIVVECCDILSELTSLTSVGLGPDASRESLQRITLVPLTHKSVTAIIVTDKGHVENKTFAINPELSLEDLNNCVSLMNDLLVGCPINEILDKLEDEVKPILAARIRQHELLFNAFMEAFVRFAGSNVHFSGKENMLYQPEYSDVVKVRKIVKAFENNDLWRQLNPVDQGMMIRIGDSDYELGIEDVSIISSSFKTGDHTHGSISVIGPTRMQYNRVVSLVEYISNEIQKIFDDEEVE